MAPDDEAVPSGLAAVAASAGVSIATVSKVVNGRADVSPQTRARVQHLLEEHAYVTRRSARPPENGQTTVELVLHGDLTGYALAVLDGVLRAGAAAGVTVAVSTRPRPERPGGAAPSTSAWVRSMVAKGRAAVIDLNDDIRPTDLNAFSRSRLPLVVLDPISLPRREVFSVGTTNFSGGLTATQHLIDLGHRRIAFLGASRDAIFNTARMHGYRAALESAAITFRADYVQTGDYDYEAGMHGGGVLLDLQDPPTAIFAVTDESAAGVYEAARLRGLRVPEDLSVVGFDDAPIARLLSPPLTTVRQPLHEMGGVALRTALRLVAGQPPDSHHVELATELVLRSSSAREP